MRSQSVFRLWVPFMVALFGAAGCVTEGVDGESPSSPEVAVLAQAPSVAEPAPGFRLFADERSGCRFPVPLQGMLLESRHFEGVPSHQIRHQITLKIDDRSAVRIDIWDDPQHRSLAAWVDEHLGFLLDDDTTTSSRMMTRSQLDGMLLERPASPQAPAYTTAVFNDGGRVFRVTCLDADDPAAKGLFEQLISGFEPGRQP